MDRRGAPDDDRQCCDDICAEPAALVRTSHCVCRPQQRGLFYQMVSGIPQDEIRSGSGRRAARNSLEIVIASAAKQSRCSKARVDCFVALLLAMTRNTQGISR